MEGPERNCIYWSHRGRFDFLFAGGTAIVGTMGDPDRQNGPVRSSYGGQHRAGCGEFVPVKIAVGG